MHEMPHLSELGEAIFHKTKTGTLLTDLGWIGQEKGKPCFLDLAVKWSFQKLLKSMNSESGENWIQCPCAGGCLVTSSRLGVAMIYLVRSLR